MLQDKLMRGASFPITMAGKTLGTMLSASVLLTAMSAQTSSGVPDPSVRQEATSHSGMATCGVHAAEFDKEHRPITAGGFVKTGPVIFLNTAEQAGITTWHHTAGTPEKHFILEAN